MINAGVMCDISYQWHVPYVPYSLISQVRLTALRSNLADICVIRAMHLCLPAEMRGFNEAAGRYEK